MLDTIKIERDSLDGAFLDERVHTLWHHAHLAGYPRHDLQQEHGLGGALWPRASGAGHDGDQRCV